MRKFYSILLLILLIGSATAVADDKQNKQLQFNLGGTELNRITDQSASVSTVAIKSYSFQPSTLTISAGTTVTWKNHDSASHTVSSNSQGLFDSGTLAPGKDFSFTFSSPGSYSYHCSLHPGMKGTVVVSGSPVQGSSATMSTKRTTFTSTNQGSNENGDQSQQSQGASGSKSSASWSEESLSEAATSGLASAAAQTKLMKLTLPGSGQSTSSGESQGSGSGDSSSGSESSNAVLKYSQYFETNSISSAGQTSSEPISAPKKFDLNGKEPATLYFGSTQKAVPYTQYKALVLNTGVNSLWIQGTSSWTQYAAVPLGASLNLIGTSSASGYGYLYEIYPDGTLSTNSYYFYPYNQIGFYADQIGQHLLFFNIAGQPSNIIVVDVKQYQPPTPPVNNYALVTIQSSWLRGYDVSLDGVYQATEGMTGEAEGTVSIYVPGDQYHTVSVSGNGFSFTDYKYFHAGTAYTLFV
ncbi:MAG: hypothetical protein EHM14_02715 [Methanothrix sp.]|nr:MAG: hypothetical protein EHM14_02715 [Methanothrix sp.]